MSRKAIKGGSAIATTISVVIQNNLFPIAGFIEDEDLYNDENFTPIDYLDFYRDFMNGFDLDPFSCAIANQNVKASTFWTKRDNAFTQDWTPYLKKWINPPYSKGLIEKAVDWALKFRHIGETLLLVNSNTSSPWYKEATTLTARNGAFCFTDRIEFYNSVRLEKQGKKSKNSKGQTIFYYGDRWQEFADISRSLGAVGRGC